MGGPGCGKTVFSLQCLVRGAQHSREAVEMDAKWIVRAGAQRAGSKDRTAKHGSEVS